MSMEYVRKAYGVPAKRGRLFEAYYLNHGVWTLAYRGRITSASHYIHSGGSPFHPTYGIVYLDDDGTVLMDTREALEGTDGR